MMTSIRRELLLWLLIGLTSSMVVAAYAVYAQTRAEAGELFDSQLQLMAGTFPGEGFASAVAPPLNETDPDNVLVVRIWDRNGAQLYVSHPRSSAPDRADVGFSIVTTPSGRWRVYTAFVGNSLVQISQPMSVREELAARLALRAMLPLLILLPVLAGLIWIAVGRGLKPLNQVASAVSKRPADALDPLPADRLPSEVRPLISALNGWLGRLGHALNSQRSFIADAAHGLRTPLTAVKLQIQLAERATTNTQRAEAFAQLKAGVERAARLVQQLLNLARTEPEAEHQPFTTVDLTDVARKVVADLASIAEEKGIDLGLTSESPVSIKGDSDALRVMLSNLVDNAIHYTPTGGTIDVRVEAKDGRRCLSVADSGPGIPPAERELVFDRFYRHESNEVTGSGLGLAIVRRVALRHGASIELGEGINGRGLKVTVSLPGE